MGKHIQDVNSWLRNSRRIFAFMKKKIKDTKKERVWKEIAERATEQFLTVFLRTIRDQAIL